MKNLLTAFCSIILITLFSGFPQPIHAQKTGNAVTIDSLLIFPIYSQIDIIETGNVKIRCMSYSLESEAQIKIKLQKYLPETIKKKYIACDDELEKKLVQANIRFTKKLRGSFLHDKYNVEVPEILLKLLDSMHQDYGLIMIQHGFTRTPENFRDDYINRREEALASLGFWDTEPNESYSTMIGFIIERKTKRVIMHKELKWRNRNPNEEVVIRSQVRDIIWSYFQ